ncbi:hypothetical protein AGMMS49940_23880 [Spirochaetia bacterium]|nr:hypothetical protein AGMMS49940_23880 [Spirochaetia bacterium]
MPEHEPAHIYDLIFKRLMRLSQGAIVQFINGLFNTDYPVDSRVDYPSTETITDDLTHVVSDMLILIGGEHLYHIEAQINNDENMALRVFNYGYLEGLKRKTVEDALITIPFPDARIIYWETTHKTPDTVTLRLQFPDGNHYDYGVDTFKFLDHSIHELEEKKLSILLPFYMLKLRKRVTAAQSSQQRQELSELMKNILEELIRTVDHSTQNGLMTKEDMRTVVNLLGRLYADLYKSYEEFKGASTMVQEVLLTYSEEAALKAELKRSEEIAGSLVQLGMDIEKIAEITKLDIETVKNLAEQD